MVKAKSIQQEQVTNAGGRQMRKKPAGNTLDTPGAAWSRLFFFHFLITISELTKHRN
jgi:hypothetical protein